ADHLPGRRLVHIDFLRERFAEAAEREALIWRDRAYTYGWLLGEIDALATSLDEAGVARGDVVSLEADFSPRAVALLLALIERNSVLVPLTSSVEEKKPEFREIAEVETVVEIRDDDSLRVERTGRTAGHEFLQ